MHSKLSSNWTFFYKFIFPGLFVGGFAFVTLMMFLSPEGIERYRDFREMRWGFLEATLIIGVVCYWSGMRLKEVKLDGDVLLVSNFRKQVAIPLHAVECVSGSIMWLPELIWLRFRRPTEFGTKILFAPQRRALGGFSRHPLVDELSQLIDHASSETQEAP